MKSLNEMAFEILEGVSEVKNLNSLRQELKSALMKYEGKEITTDTQDKLKADLLYACNVATLKKNELLATVFNTGAVKFDFGPDVPEEVKEAAMDWAKKRGLKATEASLNKSSNAYNYVVFGDSPGQDSTPISSYKLS